MLPLESVPNFSEGRDRATIDAIGAALSAHARLLDVHVDADHNRSVFTLVGEDGALVDALVAAVEVARERIDLRQHEGAHPRIGVADVVPLVALRQSDMERARQAALALGERLGALGLPGLRLRAAGARAGVLPARRRRGAAGADRRGRARAGLRAGADRPGGRRRHRRRAAAADRVQREPARLARGGEGDRRRVRERTGGFPGVRALGLDAAGGGPRAGLDERRGLGGGRAARDRRARSPRRRRSAGRR